MVVISESQSFKTKPLLLAPSKVLELDYVKVFMNTGFAKNFQWFFQDCNERIELQSAYFVKGTPNVKKPFIISRHNFKQIFKLDLQVDSGPRLIFVTRSGKRGRNLANEKEIVSFLAGIGFEIVELDHLSLLDQIKLFSNADLICGIHGAGLTNILFCKTSVIVLEIFPADFIRVHYYWLSREFGFKYHVVTGQNLLSDRSFILNTDDLGCAINYAQSLF